MSDNLTISGAASVPRSGLSNATPNVQQQQDQFLKLLTFQLKSQNPMKPYDNQEFAAQLAQFSQLEHLSEIRNLMQEQNRANVQLSQSLSNLALPGMLGKNAKAFTENVHFDGDSKVNLGYNVAYPSDNGLITVMDGNGSVVRKIELDSANLSNGDNSFYWDGKDDAGNTLPKGNYTFFVDLESKTGDNYAAQTFTYGEIEAVRFRGDGTTLVVSGLEVSLSDVTDIATRN